MDTIRERALYMMISLILICLLTIWGVCLLNGKGSFLIAGYNAKSDHELEAYDTVAVCKFMAKVAFSLSCSLVFFLLSSIFHVKVLAHIGAILIFAIILFQFVYTYKWKRFLK
ncbi:MAG TPA: DUF3784 domain-containing protein [Candidatus Avamphibacillus intestinigallinarum]|nr:DUF3784 domain-containing protein [Candidatus Avamphibacillus intestinigallinarum]